MKLSEEEHTERLEDYPDNRREQGRAVCGMIRKFREKHAVTVHKFALLMGVTDRLVQYWEREKHLPRPRKIEMFRRLQEAFEGDGKRDVSEVLEFTKGERLWRARKLQQLEQQQKSPAA